MLKSAFSTSCLLSFSRRGKGIIGAVIWKIAANLVSIRDRSIAARLRHSGGASRGRLCRRLVLEIR